MITATAQDGANILHGDRGPADGPPNVLSRGLTAVRRDRSNLDRLDFIDG